MKGLSIHIGLNAIDKTKYVNQDGDPWDGALDGCVNDAHALERLAASLGFSTTTLLNEEATSDRVREAFENAISQLESGDLFFISYSGHGAQVPDVSRDEDDSLDETWLLFDRQWLDDETFLMMSKISLAVRVFMLSDSCHSGSVARLAPELQVTKTHPEGEPGEWSPKGKSPRPEIVAGDYRRRASLYDEIARSLPPLHQVDIGASVILISGCQDDQLSYDGPVNGAFTGAVLQTWDEGSFDGTYEAFHDQVVRRLPPRQTPNLDVFGAQDPGFVQQRPWTI